MSVDMGSTADSRSRESHDVPSVRDGVNKVRVNGDTSSDQEDEQAWTIVPGGRADHVRWLIATTLEVFPALFDDLDAFMSPIATNKRSERAGYGPFHGEHAEMMRFILLHQHRLTREEVEEGLRAIGAEPSPTRRAS